MVLVSVKLHLSRTIPKYGLTQQKQFQVTNSKKMNKYPNCLEHTVQLNLNFKKTCVHEVARMLRSCEVAACARQPDDMGLLAKC